MGEGGVVPAGLETIRRTNLFTGTLWLTNGRIIHSYSRGNSPAAGAFPAVRAFSDCKKSMTPCVSRVEDMAGVTGGRMEHHNRDAALATPRAKQVAVKCIEYAECLELEASI